MELAVAVNTHTKHTNIVLDTVDSILTYATDKVLVLAESGVWDHYRDLNIPAWKVEGFRHGGRKSPYRNVALAINLLSENWPDSEWYCYCEYDVLFASDRFKASLKIASDRKVWMLGNDGHIDEQSLPLISAMLGEKLRGSYYLIACCQFFHRDFVSKLQNINFFERFLHLTSGFSDGFFPHYSGYDVSEHLYPTLCRHFGGNIGVFATWDGDWHGASEYFPIRWRPDLDLDSESFEKASILHPVKNYDGPVRCHHRKRREEWKALRKKEKSSAS